MQWTALILPVTDFDLIYTSRSLDKTYFHLFEHLDTHCSTYLLKKEESKNSNAKIWVKLSSLEPFPSPSHSRCPQLSVQLQFTAFPNPPSAHPLRQTPRSVLKLS